MPAFAQPEGFAGGRGSLASSLAGRGGRYVHSHRLIPEGGSSKAEWLLEWDDAKFALKDPDGQPVFEAEAAYAYRVVKLYELHAEGKISFASPHGSLAFKKNPAALAELREFVEAGL